VVDEGARIGREAAHRATNVRVDLEDLLDRTRLLQRRKKPLLDGNHDALRRADADGGGADLDGLDSILDLEEAALRREGVDAAVVLRAREKHGTNARAAGLLGRR